MSVSQSGGLKSQIHLLEFTNGETNKSTDRQASQPTSQQTDMRVHREAILQVNEKP